MRLIALYDCQIMLGGFVLCGTMAIVVCTVRTHAAAGLHCIMGSLPLIPGEYKEKLKRSVCD